MRTLLYTLLALVIALAAYVISTQASASMPFVRGKYGSHCYIKGQQNGNIRHLVRYSSLEECEADAKKYEESL